MKKMIKKFIVKLNIPRIPCILIYLFRIFPINNNKIVFVNFSGKGYGDSPKYIAEALIVENKKYDLVWLVNDINNKSFPKNIRKVKMFSVKSLFELATAKYWINNSRFDIFVAKRKNQIYIQTWHGGLALKKIEYDAYDKLSDYYKKVMDNDNKMIDYMVSNSDFCTNMYRNGFKYNGNIIECGTPRNDILVNEEKIKMVKKYMKKIFNLTNEKVLLYVPTFRNNYEQNPYDIDFDLLKNNLESITNEKWKIFIRLHPRINNPEKYIKSINKYENVTKYNDIQELICLSDLVITDYSSTMFEAMIANKKVIIYANDIEKYNDDRGMYFNLNDLPFKIAHNNIELINIIKSYNDISNSHYKEFTLRVGLKESGNSCEEVVKIIKKYEVKK